LDSVLPSALKNGILDKLLSNKVSSKTNTGMNKEAGVDAFDIYICSLKKILYNELY
jgi:hypothetical protein